MLPGRSQKVDALKRMWRLKVSDFLTSGEACLHEHQFRYNPIMKISESYLAAMYI